MHAAIRVTCSTSNLTPLRDPFVFFVYWWHSNKTSVKVFDFRYLSSHDLLNLCNPCRYECLILVEWSCFMFQRRPARHSIYYRERGWKRNNLLQVDDLDPWESEKADGTSPQGRKNIRDIKAFKHSVISFFMFWKAFSTFYSPFRASDGLVAIKYCGFFFTSVYCWNN